MKAILIGVLGALFFSFTFILNHVMSNNSGSWMFSASLRYLFMFPLLFIFVAAQQRLRHVHRHIRQNLGAWIIWSTLGFVFFYVPITFVADYSPGWLISSTWQLTIICGLLLAPLFYEHVHYRNHTILVRECISWRSVAISSIMIVGVVLVQIPNATSIKFTTFLLSVVPLVIAGFCYPLGNRKMMVLVDNQLSTFERIYGMTLVTLPIWLVIFGVGVSTDGLPSMSQTLQSFIVAIFSGIIATFLFFYATNLVKHNQAKLAAVESTQAMEIVFTLIGEMLLLGIAFPAPLSIIGIIIIMFGIIIYSMSNALIQDKQVDI